METFPSLCSLLGLLFYFYLFLLMILIYSIAEQLQTCTNMVCALVRAQRVDSIYSRSLLLSSPQFCNQRPLLLCALVNRTLLISLFLLLSKVSS